MSSDESKHTKIIKYMNFVRALFILRVRSPMTWTVHVPTVKKFH